MARRIPRGMSGHGERSKIVSANHEKNVKALMYLRETNPKAYEEIKAIVMKRREGADGSNMTPSDIRRIEGG